MFIIHVASFSDAIKALNYTTTIISIFDEIYSDLYNNHYGLILFSAFDPLIVFDLNQEWDTETYLNEIEDIFQNDSLLFTNNDEGKDELAIMTAKEIFDSSNRSLIYDEISLRRLAIYLSPQNNYNIKNICNFTKTLNYDIDDIEFYGAQIYNNGTFNCYGNDFKFITNSIVTYNDLYNDIDYLLSTICPHTLIPTISPTFDPTQNPSLSPTVQWKKVLITNKTCIDSSKRQQFRFNLPFNGIVSGISFKHVSGWRKEDQLSDTIPSFWGSALFNQFSIFVKNVSTDLELYPMGLTRGYINCQTKLFFYYCLLNNITVNDTELTLYAPSYSVSITDEWSVFYADDILEQYEQGTNKQNMGTICFAVNLLYDLLDSSSPSISPTTIKPSINPTQNPITLSPTNNPSKTDNPSKSPLMTTLSTETSNPTSSPSSLEPTSNPTTEPTAIEFPSPTLEPTIEPTPKPIVSIQSVQPSITPTTKVTDQASIMSTNGSNEIAINTTLSRLLDCCEFFSDVKYSTFLCDPQQLKLMKNISNYLMKNNVTCISRLNCGYDGYLKTDGVNNKCLQYWLKIVMFKSKCSLPLDAYDLYSNHVICYLCNKYQVNYTNIDQYPQGICPSNIDESIIVNNNTSKYATFNSTNYLNKEEIIIDHQNENKTIINNNEIGSRNDCNNNNSEEICKKDDTLKICLLIVFFTAIATGFIMFIISFYYKTNYISRNNATYDEGTPPNQMSGALTFSALSYIRHFSDKSDVEDVKRKIKKKENKKKVKKDISKSKEKAKKKEKEKARTKKNKNEMKSQILAAISDSDDIELQSIVTDDD